MDEKRVREEENEEYTSKNDTTVSISNNNERNIDEKSQQEIIKTKDLPINSELSPMDLYKPTSDNKGGIHYENSQNDDGKTFKLDNDLVDYKSYVKVMQERQYSRRLIHLEYVSIFMTALSFIIYAVLAYEDESAGAFAFSVDCFLDVLTYIIVIWRFSNLADIESSKKDRKAQIVIGFIFVLSALGVEYESIHNLVYLVKPEPSFLFIIIGVIEAISFGILSILKFLIAKKFESNKTIISDGINSLIAALSAFSMTIGMSIYVCFSNIWYLDAIFGFFMGLFVFIYGLKLIIDNTCFYR